MSPPWCLLRSQRGACASAGRGAAKVAEDKSQVHITFAAKIDDCKFVKATGAQVHPADPYLPVEQSGAGLAHQRKNDPTKGKAACGGRRE